jgi:uncharacterized protein (TIGR02145 family)
MIIKVNKTGYTPVSYSPIVDLDGNVYTTVRIGHQEWTQQNLKVTKYSDGVNISNTISAVSWGEEDTAGAYCEYDNSTGLYKESYGYLYNWYAVNQHAGDPTGGLVHFTRNGIHEPDWRVSTMTDISTLSTYLGGSAISGQKLKEAGNLHWLVGAKNTNESKFTMLPGGERAFQAPNWIFTGLTQFGFLWTSTSYDTTDAYYYFFDYNTNTIRNYPPNISKLSGLSIRCVRDI